MLFPHVKPPLGVPIYEHDPSLLRLWLMNEGTGDTVYDLSGNSTTGTFAGGASWSSGAYGPAVLFSGDGYIATSLPNMQNANGHTWVMEVTWPYEANKVLIDAQDVDDEQLMFIFQNNDLFQIQSYRGAVAYRSSFAKLDGNRHHLVAVMEEGVFGTPPRLYLDGVRQDTSGSPQSYGVNGNANDMRLGGRLIANYEATAKVEYLYIYNRALSASEIASLYAYPFAMFERPSIELWSAATLGGESGVSISVLAHHHSQMAGAL